MTMLDKPLNIIVPMILFILLTPGLLVTLPDKGDKVTVAIVHTLIFGAIYTLLRTVFAKYY